VEEKYEAYVEFKLCAWSKFIEAGFKSEKAKEFHEAYSVCPNSCDAGGDWLAKGTRMKE
jgi:hypothetical protein